MQRHSSAPRPEDDALDPSAHEPARSDAAAKRGGRHGSTSAKYARSRADMLDRRKGGLMEPRPARFGDDVGVPQLVSRKTAAAKSTDNAADMAGSGASPRRRGRSPWRSSVLVLVTTAVSTLLLVAIVHSFFTRQIDQKGCKMCGMWPAYAKLDGFDTEHTRFASKYSLYLYREAILSEDTTVKGVPVLFITGNAGSYRQVRPLAAEAAHYYHENLRNEGQAHANGTRELDFFTADFNEDITAFHGQTLLDQAEYLNEAVAYILSLYHDPARPRRFPGEPDPTSVIVLGHSMGGLVARAMLTMPNYQANAINTIVTMATPHARPPVSFDADIVRAYADVNAYWRRAYARPGAAHDNPLAHVTLVSIAGGGLDTTVPSDYAGLASLVPATHGFTVFASTIPGVWTGADHLSILWCDQLRRVVARALLNVVDVRRPTQTRPRAERMRIFQKWLLTGLERGTEKALPHARPTTLLTLEDEANAILRESERLVLRGLGGAGRPKTYLFPVPPPRAPEDLEFHVLSDQALDRPEDGAGVEVLFCSVFPLHPGHSAAIFSMDMDLSGTSSGSTRLACRRAPSDVVRLPASTAASKHAFDDAPPFSYLRYDLNDLSEHQYVAVVDRSHGSREGWVLAEFASKAASFRTHAYGLGAALRRGFHTVLPAQRPLAVEIRLPALHSSLLAYKLRLGGQACGDRAPLFAPLLRQYASEPFESKYFVNARAVELNMHAGAPFMPPPLRQPAHDAGLTLQIWSDPTCNTPIDLDIKLDLLGSLGKLVMRYRTVFPAIPLVIIALVLRKQFMIHDRTGIFMPFSEALDRCLRTSLPMLLLAITVFSLSLASAPSPADADVGPLGGGGGSVPRVLNATDLARFGQNDLLLGAREPFFWFLVPLFGLLGVGVCVWIHAATRLLTHALSRARDAVVWAMTPPLLQQSQQPQQQPPPAPEPRKAAALSPLPLPPPVAPSTLPPVTPSTLRRRLTIALALLLMVSTVIPYQFAYMVACLVQLATAVRALSAAREARTATATATATTATAVSGTAAAPAVVAAESFAQYAHSLLVLMLCVLPINIPVFVVWVHNLAVHWLTPFASHHNVLSIAPFVVLVETLTAGTMIPRVTGRFRHVTNLLFFLLAVYAALYGVSFAYRLHHLANLIAAWLVCVHLSAGGWSLRQVGQLLGGSDGAAAAANESDLKKRP